MGGVETGAGISHTIPTDSPFPPPASSDPHAVLVDEGDVFSGMLENELNGLTVYLSYRRT